MQIAPLNVGWIIALSIAILFYIVYPLILAFIVRLRLHVGWRYFGFGALIFLIFQLVTRVPAVAIIQGLITPALKNSLPLTYLWAFTLALTAALFEEVGRYLGYRVFMGKEEKTWSKAIMYGLGHGGLESIVLVGGGALLSLVSVVLTTTNFSSLPPAQQTLAAQQLQSINAAGAWTPLIGVWERFWAIAAHVAFSVLVLQVFRRRNLGWLGLAILLHFVLDFTAIGLQVLLGAGSTTILLIEIFVALFGLLAIWIIWRLRDQPAVPMQPATETPPPDTTEPASEPL